MEQSIKKFLEFNRKKIYFKSFDGQWWIAIKPICEALGVDYIRQFKNVKEDEILSRVLSNQTIHDASNRLQKMTCLPEFFIYGWIFQIQSNSKTLIEYKWKCYEVLHNYFHGSITDGLSHFKEISAAEKELEKIDNELMETDLFQKRQALVNTIRREKKAAQKAMLNHFTQQIELFQ